MVRFPARITRMKTMKRNDSWRWRLWVWPMLALTILGMAAGLPACTVVGAIAYDGARSDAARACEAYPSMADRNACLGRLDVLRGQDSEKVHQQAQTGDSQRAAAQRDDAAKRQQALCFKRQSTGETVCPN